MSLFVNAPWLWLSMLTHCNDEKWVLSCCQKRVCERQVLTFPLSVFAGGMSLSSPLHRLYSRHSHSDPSTSKLLDKVTHHIANTTCWVHYCSLLNEVRTRNGSHRLHIPVTFPLTSHIYQELSLLWWDDSNFEISCCDISDVGWPARDFTSFGKVTSFVLPCPLF